MTGYTCPVTGNYHGFAHDRVTVGHGDRQTMTHGSSVVLVDVHVADII